METRTFLSFLLCFNSFMILIANGYYKSWENMLLFHINESIVLINRMWITLACVEDMKSRAGEWILNEGQKWQVKKEMENWYLNAKEEYLNKKRCILPWCLKLSNNWDWKCRTHSRVLCGYWSLNQALFGIRWTSVIISGTRQKSKNY